LICVVEETGGWDMSWLSGVIVGIFVSDMILIKFLCEP
jgi:hypothetical protein